MDANLKNHKSENLTVEEVLYGDLSKHDSVEEILENLSDRDLGGSYSTENLPMTYLSDSDVTGGDGDNDWYQAEGVGEEAVGGENPTPDQNVTDDLLRSVGIDNEEGAEVETYEQLVERDRDRWELEPNSAEDY